MLLPALVVAVAATPNVLPGHNMLPGVNPGAAKVDVQDDEYTLSNDALSVSWVIGAKGDSAPAIDNGFFVNKLTGERQFIGFPFQASAGGDVKIWPFGLKLKGKPVADSFKGDPQAQRVAARCNGKDITATLEDAAHHLEIDWKAILTDGANYVRQEITFRSTKGELGLSAIDLIQTDLKDAKVSGTVPGSPVVTKTLFCGLEHPMSTSKVDGEAVTCSIGRKLPLKEGVPVTYSSVFGVAPPGQLRRGFLNYVERERARPYMPFLHYNSWYDVGYFTPYTEADCLDSINAFGQELTVKRGVKLDSFLFDDGWDDHQTVWEFSKAFPDGFTPVKEAAEKYGAEPGIWLSPWGGYGDPREQRLATGKKLGYEIDGEGYALSGPKYYERFRNVCLELVGKYGINQFKLDGTGDPDKQYPGSAFASDFEAAIQLIKDLRAAKPGLFINLTTGTWPSPFWLGYADSIWRGGDDHSFAGVGTKRQQWITYRDSDTYAGIVQKGPMFPVTSLMLHGLIYAQHAHDLTDDPSSDFASEVHDYFGNGTQLQEMYITHKLLTDKNWDDIAEAAKWSKANAETLVDSHWIGGDPSKLEVYGWASWSTKKGILVLRNPSDKTQDFSVDVAKAFELPERHPGKFVCHSPWASDASTRSVDLKPGEAHKFHLGPFEVLVLDCMPRR